MDIETITLFCGTAMNLMPILHVFKMSKDKSSAGQSILGTIILFFGFIAWTTYSIHIDNKIMIITNSFGLTVSIVYFLATIYYRFYRCLQSRLY